MQSMLLIELAVFRNNIISFRPNAKTEFIGKRLGATISVKNKLEFRNAITKNKKTSTEFYRDYCGSSKAIETFLKGIIK